MKISRMSKDDLYVIGYKTAEKLAVVQNLEQANKAIKSLEDKLKMILYTGELKGDEASIKKMEKFYDECKAKDILFIYTVGEYELDRVLVKGHKDTANGDFFYVAEINNTAVLLLPYRTKAISKEKVQELDLIDVIVAKPEVMAAIQFDLNPLYAVIVDGEDIKKYKEATGISDVEEVKSVKIRPGIKRTDDDRQETKIVHLPN